MASGLISVGVSLDFAERRVFHRRYKDPFTLRKIVADHIRNSVGLPRARRPLDNDAVRDFQKLDNPKLLVVERFREIDVPRLFGGAVI